MRRLGAGVGRVGGVQLREKNHDTTSCTANEILCR